jgi:hypothetical protein
MEDFGVFWVFTVLPADATAPPATPSPTPAPRPTAPPPSGAFVCTEFVGYSQTTSWYSDPSGFRSVTALDQSRYELLWNSGGAVHLWADPAYAGWSNGISFGCAQSSTAPDRVVMDVTEDFYLDDPANGGVAGVVTDIRNVIATIRRKYGSVRQIYLQPVVGGPGGSTCTVGGVPVRASVNHPFIDQAIDQVVAGGSGGFDVRRGADPTVSSCADYSDYIGHLSDTSTVGRYIGSWYATNAPQ